MSFSSLGVATLGQKKFLSKQTINDFWIQNDLLSKKIFLLYQQKKDNSFKKNDLYKLLFFLHFIQFIVQRFDLLYYLHFNYNHNLIYFIHFFRSSIIFIIYNITR